MARHSFHTPEPGRLVLTNTMLYDFVFTAAICILFFFFLVIPNAFRGVTLPVFLCLGLAFILRRKFISKPLMLVWVASSFITSVYLLVGILRFNISAEAINQTIFVYILSPLIWILVLNFVFSKYHLRPAFNTGFFFSFIGALTVPVFALCFTYYGPDSIRWFIASPNVDITGDYSKVNLHVYGSLAFFIAGFFASPQMIRNLVARYFVGVIFLIALLLSGRTALVSSLFIGLFFFMIFNLFGRRINVKQIFYFLSFLFLVACTIYFLSVKFDFNIIHLIHAHFTKIGEGGGEERILQARALSKGIFSNVFLGSGHGVGVEVIRNEEFPWRYELLLLATLFRVGFIGSIVYALPGYFVVKGYIRTLRSKILRPNRVYHRFMLVGFITGLYISATNPYLESFDFQWMFWGPFVYFARIYYEER